MNKKECKHEWEYCGDTEEDLAEPDVFRKCKNCSVIQKLNLTDKRQLEILESVGKK